MGVVYHGNYAQYMEMGRVEWLREMGISYKKMEEDGIMLPVISLHIEYKKPAVYDDLITVRTILKKTPSVKIEFDFEIYNEKREILATAKVVLAFIDIERSKPVRCPQYLLDTIAKN
jgi:acyl-CoA thioester hydrolase